MEIKEEIIKKLEEIVKELTSEDIKVEITIPKAIKNGDYTTNIAMQLFVRIKDKGLGIKSPMELAQKITEEFNHSSLIINHSLDRVEAVKPGFINFYLSEEELLKTAEEVLANPEKAGTTESLKGKRIMVEFAHPNTHKELHVGHMRTLTTGESLARIFTANGATVFRANYQGDIGPHVAKAIYGIQKMMEEQHLSLEEVEKWKPSEKAHFLGQGYARGSNDFEGDAKEEINELNTALYKRDPQYMDMYQRTRQWSLDYYEEFYKRFYTTFDHLFFEGDLDSKAKQIVTEHVGKVFREDADGSIVFPGEQYGLHTRVFITQRGNPTYEGKEIALGFAEYEAFPFDLKMHVVASEQIGYFKVVFKALEFIDPEKFVGRQYHLPMGMVQLVGRKMSSRTGDVLTVDELLTKVKEASEEQFKDDKLSKEEKDTVLEAVTIGAVKYSILKGGVTQNALFDIEKSVSLQGNSGPYVQYTYTRTQSVLSKAHDNFQFPSGYVPNEEELGLLRAVYQFREVVEEAARAYSPNTITEYLFNLAQIFNNFYQKYRILNASGEQERDFRIALTAVVGIVIRQGLNLLGIQAPDKM